MDFGAFVSKLRYSPKLRTWMHFRSQSYYLSPGVDFIGRLENIERDFATVTEKLGVKATLPHANPTLHEKPGISPATRRRIECIYVSDYDRCGY